MDGGLNILSLFPVLCVDTMGAEDVEVDVDAGAGVGFVAGCLSFM